MVIMAREYVKSTFDNNFVLVGCVAFIPIIRS